jgi:hypothetical protein
MHLPLPRFLRRIIVPAFMKFSFKYDKWLQKATQLTVNETHQGHLFLADFSGDTSYVASTESSHSQEILTELLEGIIEASRLC